jgi:hypothetical protein
MSEQRLIAEFTKNSLEKVKVHVQRWKNQHYVDIRVFFLDEEKAEHATRKGLTLSTELLPQLRSAIDAAISAIEDGGEKRG